MKKPLIRQEKQLSRDEISLRVQRAVQEGKLDPSILSFLDVRFAEALERIPEEVAQSYDIPKQFSETRSFPHKTSKTEKKVSTSRVRLRSQKALLAAELRGRSLTPSEQDIQSLLDAIRALSLPQEEERVLFRFYDLNEPPLEQEADYWKLEARMFAICRNLPETPESKRFFELVGEMQSKVLVAAVATEGWIRSNEILRRHYEETEDSNALGAAVDAIKEVDGAGPIEDSALIPEEWIRRGISKFAFESRRIPTVGGGRKKKLTAKETKENTKASKRDYVNDKRAFQYCDKAWQQYEAKKNDLFRRGIFEHQVLDQAVENIKETHLTRGSTAKRTAHQWFTDKVKRDIELLLSKKILR